MEKQQWGELYGTKMGIDLPENSCLLVYLNQFLIYTCLSCKKHMESQKLVVTLVDFLAKNVLD